MSTRDEDAAGDPATLDVQRVANVATDHDFAPAPSCGNHLEAEGGQQVGCFDDHLLGDGSQCAARTPSPPLRSASALRRG